MVVLVMSLQSAADCILEHFKKKMGMKLTWKGTIMCSYDMRKTLGVSLARCTEENLRNIPEMFTCKCYAIRSGI